MEFIIALNVYTVFIHQASHDLMPVTNMKLLTPYPLFLPDLMLSTESAKQGLCLPGCDAGLLRDATSTSQCDGTQSKTMHLLEEK